MRAQHAQTNGLSKDGLIKKESDQTTRPNGYLTAEWATRLPV